MRGIGRVGGFRAGVAVLSGALLLVVSATPVGATPGDVLWLKRYNGSASSDDNASAVAVRPDGSMVFVAGTATDTSGNLDYTTVAYNATTGVAVWRRWFNGYSGGGSEPDQANAIAVSPDGSKVFVTGESYSGPTTGYDWATVAYSATTGSQLWVKRYNSVSNDSDFAESLAVSPDGSRLFVAGISENNSWPTLVAYNTATAAQLWVRKYLAPGTTQIRGGNATVRVSPDGSKVYLAGTVNTLDGGDFVTIAYNANGNTLWTQRYTNGTTKATFTKDGAAGFALSPNGSKVFVTGRTAPSPYTNWDWQTVAYNATTGAVLWTRQYNGPGADNADSIATSRDGSKVFVTGDSASPTTVDSLTIAYNATTGIQVWSHRVTGATGESDFLGVLAVSPDGSQLIMTGSSLTGAALVDDYSTTGLNPVTGAALWSARYNGPGDARDDSGSVAISPDSTKAFVTGTSFGGPTTDYDWPTIAYTLH
jgi:outer membrane protein assembly factor BamB